MVGVEVPRDAIVKESNAAYRNTYFVGFLGLIVLTIVIYIISRSITDPLGKITTSLQLLARGEINKVNKLEFNSKDEIGDIAASTNILIEGLSNTAMFAKEIGQGNLQANYESVSESDILGNALIGMRQSLQKAQTEEELRRATGLLLVRPSLVIYFATTLTIWRILHIVLLVI
jgi:methyl-accepting chemotaxis protein